MGKQDEYQFLVDAFYQSILNKEDEALLKHALTLAAGFDNSTVKDAMREASVMSVVNSTFKA